MTTMSERVESLGITIDWTANGFKRDESNWEYQAFTVTLSRPNGEQITVPWRQGMGIDRDPGAADVLDALASEADGADEDFENWADSLGYDTDSRRAGAIYEQVRAQTDALRAFLGDDFDALVYDTERL